MRSIVVAIAATLCAQGCVGAKESAQTQPVTDTVVAAAGVVEISAAVPGIVAPQAGTPDTTSASSLDTGLVDATADELAELARSLIVPVSGVMREDLRDTFSESRGGGSRAHDAIDIPAPRNSPVLAATDGRIEKLHRSATGGLMIYAADANDRFVMMYGHLDAYVAGITEGMPVRQGQVIGYVGTTGNAPPGTPHLHFAVARGTPSRKWWRGRAVNPYPLLTRGAGG